MIIVLKPHSPEETITRVENMVKTRGLDTHIVKVAEMTIIGCIGDTTRDRRETLKLTCVTKLCMYRSLTNLQTARFIPEDSVIDVSGVKVGGGHGIDRRDLVL